MLDSFCSSDVRVTGGECPSVLRPVSQDRLPRLDLRVLLLLLQHLGSELRLLVQSLRLLAPLALGLHPGDETEEGPPEEGGDPCQVEGHVIAAQPVPEEP